MRIVLTVLIDITRHMNKGSLVKGLNQYGGVEMAIFNNMKACSNSGV